jgi:hypothetical protein
MRTALAATSPGAATVPPPIVPHGYGPSAAAPTPPFHTTAPFVATPHAPPSPSPSSSGLGIVAVVLAALALLVVLGAAGAGAAIYFRGQAAAGSNGPAGPSPPAAGARAISPPNVRSSEEFDRANAVAVAQKNHPSMEACAAKSHRFNGTIDVVFDVSSHDGRVVGTDCQTVWPSHDSKHPKLDPEAAELCACIQGVTSSWKFKPPKAEVPIFDDTVWLHVHYVCAR